MNVINAFSAYVIVVLLTLIGLDVLRVILGGGTVQKTRYVHPLKAVIRIVVVSGLTSIILFTAYGFLFATFPREEPPHVTYFVITQLLLAVVSSRVSILLVGYSYVKTQPGGEKPFHRRLGAINSILH